MPLIPLDQVKSRFPGYYNFLDDADGDLPARVEAAEEELARYVHTTAPLSRRLTSILMALVRKAVFDVQHGDTEFDHRPQILRDYDTAIEDLKLIRLGLLPIDETTEREDAASALESKPRRFGVWFRD